MVFHLVQALLDVVVVEEELLLPLALFWLLLEFLDAAILQLHLELHLPARYLLGLEHLESVEGVEKDFGLVIVFRKGGNVSETIVTFSDF